MSINHLAGFVFGIVVLACIYSGLTYAFNSIMLSY